MQLSKSNATRVMLSKAMPTLTETAYFYPVYSATTAHAYVINLEAATHLLKVLYPVWRVADTWCRFEEYGAMKLLTVHPAPVLLHELAQQTTRQPINNIAQHNPQKCDIWAVLMANRPLRVRLRHRYGRAELLLLHRIVDVNVGAKRQEKRNQCSMVRLRRWPTPPAPTLLIAQPVTVPLSPADNSSQNNINFDFNFVECLCASIMTCYRVSG
ncbi:hypothetical protein [Pantoea sp. AS142]|uniref:hypothetical protein n=1 Tax=Pantoea sp. AS142 TaxID=3081292 RepID=UPI003017387A